jgi:hypothetical protein
MTSSSLRRVAAIATLLCSGSVSVLAADPAPASAAGNTGELWDVTSQMQMSMQGMNMDMPAQKLKACARRGEPPAPVDAQRKCRRLESNSTGSTVSWKEICAGPPETTGEGKITYSGPGAYTGTIRYKSSDGDMTMKLTGKRVGGACKPI